MRVNNLIFLVALGAVALVTSACGGAAGGTPTRVVTQTPFIIFVPVTTTPEPATVTPLPTITPESIKTPTRTATRVVVVVRPTATKAPPTIPAGPPPTVAPACTASPVTLLDPENGAPRTTRSDRPGSDTFRLKWSLSTSLASDSQSGYKIQIDAKKAGGKQAGADAVYISHNKYRSLVEELNQPFIYDAQKVYNLPQGDEDVTVFWNVTVIKTTGSFDDVNYKITGTEIKCSPPSETRTIALRVEGP